MCSSDLEGNEQDGQEIHGQRGIVIMVLHIERTLDDLISIFCICIYFLILFVYNSEFEINKNESFEISIRSVKYIC